MDMTSLATIVGLVFGGLLLLAIVLFMISAARRTPDGAVAAAAPAPAGALAPAAPAAPAAPRTGGRGGFPWGGFLSTLLVLALFSGAAYFTWHHWLPILAPGPPPLGSAPVAEAPPLGGAPITEPPGTPPTEPERKPVPEPPPKPPAPPPSPKVEPVRVVQDGAGGAVITFTVPGASPLLKTELEFCRGEAFYIYTPRTVPNLSIDGITPDGTSGPLTPASWELTNAYKPYRYLCWTVPKAALAFHTAAVPPGQHTIVVRKASTRLVPGEYAPGIPVSSGL
ncbi:MAG: hypothetical protein G01um101438_830 [Parcubacteria group bacterium Gr01-1014_38]|nr:MAG: hypothetical protein G01um101438_830 [Parcubacteria group bacterium Gr01-1014_38]